MRLLSALVMALVVCISLPTLVAAAPCDDVPIESIDSVDTVVDVASVIDASDVPDFDAVISKDVAHERPRYARTVVQGIRPTCAGPNGFSTRIWRPVAQAERILHRNYESGLSLNRS